MRVIFGDRERNEQFQHDFPFPIELAGIDVYEQIPGCRCVFVVKQAGDQTASEVKMGAKIIAAGVQSFQDGPVLLLQVENFLIFDRVAEGLMYGSDATGERKWWLVTRWLIDKQGNHVTTAYPLTYLEIILP